MRIFISSLLFLSFFILSCHSSRLEYCYEFVEPEKDSHSVILIKQESKEPDSYTNGSLTVFEYTMNNVEKEKPFKTLGKIKDSTFYYTSGGRFSFDEKEALGSGSELIEGLRFTRTECP